MKIRKELLSIVEPTLLEELDDYMLTNMTQDGCQLQISNLNFLESEQLDDDDSDEETENDMAQEQVKVQLVDLSFTLGSHVDRNLNQKEYIQPLKMECDGLFKLNLSKLPLQFGRFPVNMCLNLQIKSPICLNIYSQDRDFSMIEKTQYERKAYEIHTIKFEGNIGMYENKVKSLIKMQDQLFDII